MFQFVLRLDDGNIIEFKRPNTDKALKYARKQAAFHDSDGTLYIRGIDQEYYVLFIRRCDA